MPKFRFKFQKLLALTLLILSINSCDPGCVEPDEFDTESTYVNAKPTSDGIFGDHYDDTIGGEIAGWHDSNLRSNGNQLVLEIKGAWTAWDDAVTAAQLNTMPLCHMCAKKVGDPLNSNCICDIGQDPEPEKDTQGIQLSVDCNIASNQNDPNLCTCREAGRIDEIPGIYFFATDYQDKNEAMKLADDQLSCKFHRGIGLYVGLFGRDGNTMPTRIYQVYPVEEICDITRNSQSQCIDSDGEDQTKYVYRSPNSTTFIKDDKANNNGSDTNLLDNEYHRAGEYIKLIINDRYYSDNFGGYNVKFIGGFIRSNDNGLFEFIVGTVEDLLLGKIDEKGTRQGGILEFLFNSIVKDSTFILIVQMCLIMYIVLFGIWVLAGALPISKKELTKRVIKIGLIIFFTTETSWYFYNQLVVGLFKDGMDSLISIFMTASDKTVDTSSLIVTSQLDRANSLSYATRFAYIDVIVKYLFSVPVSKKILSLVFSNIFGIVYAVAIYALIFSFIYVMLHAAYFYIARLLSLVFVLCLGPIFMITVLFNKTDEIFKRWLVYMASQSMQIVCLFLVLYLFAVMIDKGFNEILYYKACTESVNFGLFNIDFLKTDLDRSMAVWFLMLIKIGSLLFLLKILMDQIPGVIGHMVSIKVGDGSAMSADTGPGYVAATNKSGAFIASDLLGRAKMLAGKALSAAPGAIYKTAGMAGAVGRATGITAPIDYLRNKSPVRSPITMYNDRKIDNMISAQQKLSLSGANYDSQIRSNVLAEARKKGYSDESTLRRLNQKLVKEPLETFIKDEIKNMKKLGDLDALFDEKKMRSLLDSKVSEWAQKNSSLETSQIVGMLDGYGNLIKEKGALTSSEAAKAFAGNADAQLLYLAHLEEEKNKRNAAITESKKNWYDSAANKLSRFGTNLRGKAAYNPSQTAANFVAKVGLQEKVNDAETIKGLLGNYARKLVGQTALNRRVLNANYYKDKAEIDGMVALWAKNKDLIDQEAAKADTQLAKLQKEVDEGKIPKEDLDRFAGLKKNLDDNAADFSGQASKIDVDNSDTEKARAAALRGALARYRLSQAKLALYYIESELAQLNAAERSTEGLNAAQKSRKSKLEQDQVITEREERDADREAKANE